MRKRRSLNVKTKTVRSDSLKRAGLRAPNVPRWLVSLSTVALVASLAGCSLNSNPHCPAHPPACASEVGRCVTAGGSVSGSASAEENHAHANASAVLMVGVARAANATVNGSVNGVIDVPEVPHAVWLSPTHREFNLTPEKPTIVEAFVFTTDPGAGPQLDVPFTIAAGGAS